MITPARLPAPRRPGRASPDRRRAAGAPFPPRPPGPGLPAACSSRHAGVGADVDGTHVEGAVLQDGVLDEEAGGVLPGGQKEGHRAHEDEELPELVLTGQLL